MICTLYSHTIGFDKITNILKQVYSKGTLLLSDQDGFRIAEIEIKDGIFSSKKKIKVSYRERATPSYQFPQIDDSPLTTNLKGLYGFVASLPIANDKVKSLFLEKIQTLNCEFSIIQEQGETKELKTLIQSLAATFEAVLFVQPNTVISKSGGQHFLDHELNLITDVQGNCEIDNLSVNINSGYFDGDQTELTEDQKRRKSINEKKIEQLNIKTNKNLPCVESEQEVVIRTSIEIAQRVSILAITNLVAFNSIPSEEAINYLKRYNLWDSVTPKEQSFLANPTEETKNNETWKCECIWILMWALNIVEEIGPPGVLCNLENIPPHNYPVGQSKDPTEFINSITAIRSTADILDANDLYYRLDWACVDARINNRPITEANSSVVYERHYALNWLIHYMDQDWDDVSCDT